MLKSETLAAEKAAGHSAVLASNILAENQDKRARVLKDYLEKWNSPMTENAEDFVRIADKYSLDWKLVASIAGLESSFGQHVPYNSYNGWGWGVYGDNVIRFASWEEGIEAVSYGLRTRYIDRSGTDDVYVIGRTYAASPTWATRVSYFMNSIEQEFNKVDTSGLAITI